MTPERFRTIVAAYGSDARRWPDGERAAAEAWARAHPGDALAALDDAAELDAWLANDTVAPPAPALVERIVATAPAARRATGTVVVGCGIRGRGHRRARGCGGRVDADARQRAACA